MPIPELRNTVLTNNPDPPPPQIRVPHLMEFESRGRTSHLHWDGAEVQRQFYVDTYQAAPHACAALLGFVLQEGQRFVRYLPASDPYYNEILYCNEAKWDHVDGDKKSISNSTPIAAHSTNVTAEQAYIHFMIQVNRIGEHGEGGAFITASYRPLISAYFGDAYGDLSLTPNRDRQFDFMDPVITPGSKTIPWPKGLVVKPGGGVTLETEIPEEVADPITIPIKEFTIRRMFLGKVPYALLDAALGCVNNGPWPAEGPSGWPWTIPQFPAETLRFESYEVTPHWSQLSEKNLWFEVQLRFLAISYQGSPIYNENRIQSDSGDVTWNHAFFASFGERGNVAWWYVSKITDLVERRYAPLYARISFDRLFAPVTP